MAVGVALAGGSCAGSDTDGGAGMPTGTVDAGGGASSLTGTLPQGGSGGVYQVPEAGSVALAAGDDRLVVVAVGGNPGWTPSIEGDGGTRARIVFAREDERVAFRAELVQGVIVAQACRPRGSGDAEECVPLDP